MQYSLGNMLKGGGALNPDGLALDLAFALDKTLTARRGPTPAFTRSSTATFVGSNGLIQSAAVDSPRFRHDSAGVCRGFLIEDSKINLIATSVPGTNWTSGTGAHTVTQNSTDVGVSPDGSLPTKVVCTTSGNYQISFAAVTGTQYTASIYARVLSGTGPIRVGGIIAGAFSSDTATSQWARYSKTDISATTGTRFLQLSMVAGETLYLWGAQVEAGAFATSYIPTTIGTAARSADVCSIAGTDFSSFYNQTEGTLEIEYEFEVTLTSLAGVAVISQNLYAQAIQFNRLVSTVRNTFNSAGIATLTLNATLPVLTATKNAFALKDNDSAQAVNGVIANTDTTLAIPKSMTTLVIGANGIAGGAGFQTIQSATISRVTYYRKRLSNAKLQAITTP